MSIQVISTSQPITGWGEQTVRNRRTWVWEKKKRHLFVIFLQRYSFFHKALQNCFPIFWYLSHKSITLFTFTSSAEQYTKTHERRALGARTVYLALEIGRTANYAGAYIGSSVRVPCNYAKLQHSVLSRVTFNKRSAPVRRTNSGWDFAMTFLFSLNYEHPYYYSSVAWRS